MENVNRRDFLAIEMFKLLREGLSTASSPLVNIEVNIEDVSKGQFAIYEDTLLTMKIAYSLADEMINAAGTRTK